MWEALTAVHELKRHRCGAPPPGSGHHAEARRHAWPERDERDAWRRPHEPGRTARLLRPRMRAAPLPGPNSGPLGPASAASRPQRAGFTALERELHEIFRLNLQAVHFPLLPAAPGVMLVNFGLGLGFVFPGDGQSLAAAGRFDGVSDFLQS